MREAAATHATRREQDTSKAGLRARIYRALEATNERHMVRVHLTLDLADPWALMASPLLEGRQLAAWDAPEEARCFLAVGVTRSRHPEGAGRFREAAALWELLDRSMIELPHDAGGAIERELPCLVSGFAFSATGSTRSELWRGWGDSALWVPEILVQRHNGVTRAAITAAAGSSATPELVADQIEAAVETLDALLRAAREPTSAPVIAGKNNMARVGRDAVAWEAWRDRVEAARSSMMGDPDSTLLKVVLARTERFQPISNRAAGGRCFDPLDTALALRTRQSHCTTFCVRLPDGRAFVGATPEELVRLEEREVTTMALAGTRSRGWDASNDEDLAQELLASGKDRREQSLVTDAIRSALEPLVNNLDIPEAPSVARFTDVQHLKTEIRGQLKDGVNLFDLVQRLHPTPAVGGLPRQEALAWLDANEGLDRGWYAGPLGWVSPGGSGVFVVAIRSALLRGAEAAAFAGCGLVERSDARAEWQETIFKLRAISQGLALGEET